MPKTEFSRLSVTTRPVSPPGSLPLVIHAVAGAESLPWQAIAARVLAGRDRSRAAGNAGRGAVSILAGKNLGLDFDVVVRQYRHGGLLRTLLRERFWGDKRFLAELAIHRRVLELGLPAPLPLGVMVAANGCGRPGVRGYYVTRRLEDVTGLPEYLERASAGQRRRLAIELGGYLRRLHADGIFYADLQMRNLLIDSLGRLYLIDFDKSKRFCGPLPPARRRANLYRFARSVEKYRHRGGRLSELDRIAFLQAYEPGPESYRSLFAGLGRGLCWRRFWYRLGWWVNRS